MGARIDGRQLQRFRLAREIVHMAPTMGEKVRILIDFDDTFGKIGLRPNCTKMMFMMNGLVFSVSLVCLSKPSTRS
ncbi:hypothetical protein KIN20_015930 [Parelaphostrongylus tenuis]|uniref:Uncharacterized protein n=1 Tax=Parelaphostrongylus tenuis TaxID=148309 RepID=A0AAD5MJ92_PARTN|nr:hypothetical protein KIN20_015930 [Parelaphostrongylus tenuis]